MANEDRSEDGAHNLPDCGDVIDPASFEQILEMDDDDEDREFSRQIVFDFFDQAIQTFDQMDESLEKRDLENLSQLGHFLKGSSATLGLIKVKDGCEKIQYFGKGQDESGEGSEPNPDISLRKIKDTLAIVRVEFANVERRLRAFYHNE